MYCQWQCTLLQTLTMTQPPGSHRPLHGSHLTANKVPHSRSCVGIGHSPTECSPLYHVEVPTPSGVLHKDLCPLTGIRQSIYAFTKGLLTLGYFVYVYHRLYFSLDKCFQQRYTINTVVWYPMYNKNRMGFS